MKLQSNKYTVGNITLFLFFKCAHLVLCTDEVYHFNFRESGQWPKSLFAYLFTYFMLRSTSCRSPEVVVSCWRNIGKHGM